MDEPLNTDLKLPEEDNLQPSNLKDQSLSEIVGTSSEQPLSDMGMDTLDNAEKSPAFEVNLQKASHDTLSPKESSFQVTLEPKPTDAPPLLLLDTKSGDMEDDSVFTGDLSTMPDQLLAEPSKCDELDERTEHEIASNIEEQLREFDGSEDDISLDKQICVAPSIMSAGLTRPEDIFGEDTSASAAGSEPRCKSDTPIPIVPQETSSEPIENPEPSLEEMAEILKTKEGESAINQEENLGAGSKDPTIEEIMKEDEPSNVEINLPDDLIEKSQESRLEEIEPKENPPPQSDTSEEIIFEEEIPVEELASKEISAEQNQCVSISSEETEVEQPAESSMEVDELNEIVENPLEDQASQEIAEKSSNNVIEIEDVQMSAVEDLKEGEDDVMLDFTDPLAKSGRTEDMEHDKSEEIKSPDKNVNKPETENEKNIEELINADVSMEEPLSSTTIEEASNRVNETDKSDEAEKSEDVENIEDGDKTDKDNEVEEVSNTEENDKIEEADKTKESDRTDEVEKTKQDETTEVAEKTKEAERTEEDKTEKKGTDDVEIIEIHESDESKEMTSNELETTEKDSDDVQIVEIANISVEDVIPSVSEQLQPAVVTETSQQQNDSEASKELDTAQKDNTVSEDVCLLPDTQKELTGAEKEQAILARVTAEKEAEKAKKVKEKEKQSDTRQSTPTEETANEEDQANEEPEPSQVNLSDLADLEIKELNEDIKDDKCYKCRKAKPCRYKFLRNGEVKYLCDIKCVNSFRGTSKEAYTLTAKKVIITSIIGVVQMCIRCRGRKPCGFRFKDSDQGIYIYLCQPTCLNLYIGKNIEKYLVRRKKYIVEDLTQDATLQKCIHCGEKKTCKYFFKQDDEMLYICDENCFNLLSKEEPERFRLKQRRSVRGRDTSVSSSQPASATTAAAPAATTTAAQWEPDLKIVARTEAESEAAKLDREISFTRRCGECSNTIERTDQLLHWEMIDFCNEICLEKYQNTVGALCFLCKTNVPVTSMGKYCVRFGFDVRQFCTTNCLERHKKGLKVCSFCQKDISFSRAGFLAPVGTRGVFKDFCSQSCMSRYDEMCNPNKTTKTDLSICAVCNHQRLSRVEVSVDGREHQFCSNPCFSAFKFVNNIHLDQCGMCSRYFERKSAEAYTTYQDDNPTVFCSKICMNIYISLNRKIVPCQWCKVKKYDFDMIQKQQGGQVLMLCSVNCFNQQKSSQNAITLRAKCDNCQKETMPQYHLTMSDGTMRNFCNYQCVLVFRGQFGRGTTWTVQNSESVNPKDVNNKKSPVPAGLPRRARGKVSATTALTAPTTAVASEETSDSETVLIIPVISNVESLAATPVVVSTPPATKPVASKPSPASKPSLATKPLPVATPTTTTTITPAPAPAPTPATPPAQTPAATPTTAVVITPNVPTEPVLVKKRGRPRSHTASTEQQSQQVSTQVQRQSQPKSIEPSEDDQPLVRLRSLRSGGGQNIQSQESPKNQQNISITTKALTTNSHTQTKAVQKKSIGITALVEKTPEEPTKPEMAEKSTMTVAEKTTAQEKEKSKPGTEKPSSSQGEVKTQVVVVPQKLPSIANKQTMCKPTTATKGTSCRPHPSSVQCQTDDEMGRKILVPIPVPIYVPQPMYMYSAPFPVPVPIPLPIPVPIFIPTTRNSAEGIMKEIKKIQDKMPTDPFEAELLMMAEMVAGDKKKNESDSESEPEAIKYEEEYHQTEPSEPSNSFGEDVLQMALKMATECDEPAVDLESAMTTNTITQPATAPPVPHMSQESEDLDDMSHQMIVIDGQRQVIRGKKRPASPVSVSPIAPSPRINRVAPISSPKRQRREIQVIGQSEPVVKEPVEKPDANLCLKYTFGVNAWKQWVMTKNADLEKSSIKRKPFKSELLQLTADELNYSLCLFVKEVRKPNGSEYAPDTIYYLVLGIQQYLYENGRIDNIFTDPYYERFTDCLDGVAKKFSVLYNDSQYIVTRVEEEHLWECKQLGAHSPHVLLSTLMFFNTKHFNLTTVEEHMQLSFSHIMKHWKRSPPGTKSPGSRNVLLRFYPPQSGLEANPKKKKVYEQQENEDNPLRCPVKLYEFYLSKCPESVKTRNDVFYLQPERSCVPDSPVWYSTQPLSKDALSKMLHRVKMVKEINIALLTS